MDSAVLCECVMKCLRDIGVAIQKNTVRAITPRMESQFSPCTNSIQVFFDDDLHALIIKKSGTSLLIFDSKL